MAERVCGLAGFAHERHRHQSSAKEREYRRQSDPLTAGERGDKANEHRSQEGCRLAGKREQTEELTDLVGRRQARK